MHSHKIGTPNLVPHALQAAAEPLPASIVSEPPSTGQRLHSHASRSTKHRVAKDRARSKKAARPRRSMHSSPARGGRTGINPPAFVHANLVCREAAAWGQYTVRCTHVPRPSGAPCSPVRLTSPALHAGSNATRLPGEAAGPAPTAWAPVSGVWSVQHLRTKARTRGRQFGLRCASVSRERLARALIRPCPLCAPRLYVCRCLLLGCCASHVGREQAPQRRLEHLQRRYVGFGDAQLHVHRKL